MSNTDTPSIKNVGDVTEAKIQKNTANNNEKRDSSLDLMNVE